MDEFEHVVLSEMSRDWVIVFVLQDSKSKVTYIWKVNTFVQEEESFGVYGPLFGGIIELNSSNRIGLK